MPEPEDPIILAVESVWDAIDNWSPLQGAFQQKYKLDGNLPKFDSGGDPINPHCPALAILPEEFDAEWYTNRMQRGDLFLRVKLWTNYWEYRQATRLMKRVRKAIWDSTPDAANVPYVEAATGFPPVRTTKITFSFAGLGEGKSVKLLRTEMSVQLQMRDDPWD